MQPPAGDRLLVDSLEAQTAFESLLKERYEFRRMAALHVRKRKFNLLLCYK